MKKSFESFQKTVFVLSDDFEKKVMRKFHLRKEKTKKLFSRIFFGSNYNIGVKTKSKFKFDFIFDFSEAKPVILWFVLLAIAVGGREVFQGVPSVEPIIPITVLTGYLLGPMGAVALGFNAYMASNFVVWGGHGWWTFFQSMGGAVTGLIAGVFFKFKKPTPLNSAMLVVVGTLVFEILLNVPWTIMVGWPSLLLAIPFTFIHFASNVVFSQAIPFVSKMGLLQKYKSSKDKNKKQGEDMYEELTFYRINSDGSVAGVRVCKSRK